MSIRDEAMRRFVGVLEFAAVALALFAWVLIPKLLWEQDCNFGGTVAFLILPVVFFELGHSYNDSRKSGENLGPRPCQSNRDALRG
jgi:hypothetical protein